MVLINNSYNSTGLVPKDHKFLMKIIGKYRDDLHQLAEYHYRPLPAIYKQVLSEKSKS